ncbi:MAG: RelA/SpoT family protein [Candidatus Omnitrophota bacterium]
MQKQLKQLIEQSKNPKLIEKAFLFAKEAHEGQKRFSGEDYISHPLAVAKILKEMGLDDQAVAAAFLHDVADDTKHTLKEIEKEFGKDIAFLVEGVSKLGKLRYPKESLEIKSPESRIKQPIDLKAENLRKMFFAMGEDVRVVLIKLADRLHNMRTLGSLPADKRERIALETLEIYAPLANRLGMGKIKGSLEDLAFPYLYPKEYEWLIKNIGDKYEDREKHLKEITPLLAQMLKEENIKTIDIHSRPKHYWSLYQKLLRHDMDFERIYDLIALKVIVQDIKTCYQALGAIHKQWKPLIGRIKDYISQPKPNGYQAIHTTVICFKGKIIEIQVKTKQMHEDAEYGIAAHWAAKEGVDLKKQSKRFDWVQQLKDWQEKVLKSEDFLEGLRVDILKKRIFVFTPKGDVIDLPDGATAVDFAYNVHTDIGNHCQSAKVNGKLIQLSQPLKNGDIVEIVVDKNKKPSRDWLKFTKTNLARSRIKTFLKQNNGGFRAFLKEKVRMPLTRIRRRPKIKQKQQAQMVVALAGQTGIQITLAKCCQPQTGDELKTYLTQQHSATVHKADCKNIIRAQKKWPQKVIEATWQNKN